MIGMIPFYCYEGYSDWIVIFGHWYPPVSVVLHLQDVTVHLFLE